MASSEVEIASSSPFGCVLRDRNHREACRESNVKGTHNAATFQRNINNFVIDLNTCMAVSSDSTTNENNNSSSSDSSNNNSNNNNSKQRKSPKNNHLERLCLTRSKTFNNNNNDNDNNKDESSLASLISPRHSRLLDRWAAKQAREMVSNLENEAELLSMDDNDTLPRTSSSTSEESLSETRNMGASSLVQIWEKRLNKSGMSKTNMSVDRITSSSSPNAVNENESENDSENENANAFSVEEQCFDGPSNEEPFPDWDSSDHSVSPGGRSEKDRVSVADIIRKLTTTKQNQSPTPSFVDENEHEGYGGCGSVTGSSVTSSPCRERECGGVSTQQHVEQNQRINFSLRIRGRQAYNELLMHMENDRHREVNNLAERGAVSRFAQRGRIQAVLRLRLLQREVAANDPSRQKSTESEVNNRQPPGGSAIIMQLRERFSSGAELRTPVQTEVANARSPRRETVNNTPQLNNSATTKQLRKDKSNKTACGTAIHATQSTQKSVSQAKIDHNTEEARPSSDVMVQETHPSSDAMVQEPHPSSDVKALHHDSKETTEATTTMIDSNLNDMVDRAETSNQQNAVAKSSNDKTVNEEEASNRQYVETGYLETVEEEPSNENYSESSYDDEIVDEVEDIDYNCDETNYDWISEISRPRSYWEERRQEWYREMLETGSHNEDIRTLLERRTVSSFLSSDFREKMDRLMESHRGTQTHLVNIQDQQEDSQGMMAFLQEHLHSARASQEEGRDAGEEEEEERRNQDEEEEEEEDEDNADEQEQEKEHEEESLISGSYHGVGDYSNRSSSWSYRDNETGDDFDRVDSTSPQTYQSRSFYPDSRQSPSTTHHSIEMELMYDLRGQMEQLYQEISELRKTIKGCVDMQMQLQQSMNQEVHPVKKEEKKPHKTPKKGNCCVCYEMKVDSVLYRCGHMCACLKCANELQWNSGKCPICRAKIVDVVRVYVDN